MCVVSWIAQKNSEPLSKEQLQKKEEAKARKAEKDKLSREAQKNSRPLNSRSLNLHIKRNITMLRYKMCTKLFISTVCCLYFHTKKAI